MPATNGILISAIKFDNEPFVRTLTATAVNQLSGRFDDVADYISWNYPNDPSIWATTPSGSAYTINQVASSAFVSTLYFYVTGRTYDATTQTYSLLTQTISASYRTNPLAPILSTVKYTFVYDTFPEISNPILYLNYENSRYSSLFYRTVSSTPFYFTLSAAIDERLINKTNFLSATNNFVNSTAWIPASVSVQDKVYFGPDVKNSLTTKTADLIIPLSGTPYDQIATVGGNIGNLDILRPPGIYNISSNDYTVTSTGSGAVFQIGVSLLSAVSSINIVKGGQSYRVNDLITIQNTAFSGLNINTPKLYFNVLSVNNNIHELKQTVSLSAGINTFSVYAYPSGLGGQYVYFRTNKHGNIIFDLYGRNAFNYGSWYNGSVAVTTPQQFGLSALAVGNNLWLRCFATLNLSSDDILDYSIGLTTSFSNISSNINKNYPTYLWGAQIEPRSFPTTYITGPSSQRTSVSWFNIKQPSQNIFIPLTSTKYASLCSFVRTAPCLSSIQFYISASSSVNSLTSWYTPHIFTASLSAKFVNMLTADFIGFPKKYFNPAGKQLTLDSATYTTSPGLCFYGENHTERIILSAKEYSNANYLWSFGDPLTNIYEFSSVNINTNTITYGITSTTKDIAVFVPSRIGYYPRIPINLFVTNQSILSSGPRYQFNDVTGYLEPYPFYYSTSLTLSNGTVVPPYENPNNNIFKQSIQVNSYLPPATSFKTSLSDILFLPVNSTPKSVFGTFKVTLSGGGVESIDDCYDKYNIVWKWSNLSAFNPSTSSTFLTKPSSWADAQCFLSAGSLTLTANPGRFPKKWRKQGYTLTDIQKQPEYYTTSNLYWTLSSPEWSVVNINPYTETTYNFPLQYLGNGTSPFTTSIENNTPVTLQASQTVTCIICAQPFDWGPKNITLTKKVSSNVLSKGDFRFYTSNRLVLTGVPVNFENLSKGFNNVDSIIIDLDNSAQITLTGNNIYNNFTATYNDLGRKTIVVTTRYTTGETLTEQFKNVINVVPRFDDIDVDNYRTAKTALQLPWPKAPYVNSNDWITEDNINSVIKKFYENLEYLEDRGRSYYDEPMEFYGWLGMPPQRLDDCLTNLTWENSECVQRAICTKSIPPVCVYPTPSANKTWLDFECLDPDTLFEEITANGKYYRCGTWNDQYCDPTKQNPNCFGKFGIEWKWKYRKSTNTAKVVPWKYTRKGGFYEKKWIYEPFVTQEGQTIVGLNCNEGYWNVNIPKLNTDYDPITKCTDSNNCIYTSILVKDDLIFTSLLTEIKVLSSEYDPRFVAAKRTIDDFYSFRNIRNIAFDSQGKLFVLDGTLNKVASYFFNINDPVVWEPFITWGGYGTAKSNLRFSQPNDMHVDQFDNIWVADTGNRCIKHFTNSGSWIQTIQDSDFQTNIPLSVAVDSASQVHILLLDRIRVYSYRGEFLFEYLISDHDDSIVYKLNVNNIREIIYTVSNTQVGKYFRNGAFAGFVVDNKKCFTSITGVCQDKNRNVLISAGEKIGKFVDPMRIKVLKGPLPEKYWPLNSLLIHKDEYIQDWVYNKAFQRLWDNIELFRHSLIFGTEDCNKYIPPTHDKTKILIGQNEIVTSTVINRVINYLWDNFQTLVNYFDPACILNIEEEEKQKQKSLEEVTLSTT